MANDPVIKKTIDLPYGHVLALQVTPWSVRRTIVKLLPWAVVAMVPANTKRAKLTRGAAAFLSPLVRQRK